MHFLWGWPICLLLDLTIRWQTSFEADIKLQGCTLRELFKYIKPIKDGWWRWERVAQKPARSYYIGVQGHFYWAPPEAVSWWGFSWIKGSQIVCRGHLSHPKTVFWYTKCGIVFNHLYEAVSDQDPVWVRSEEKIPSGFESTPNIIFSMPQYSLVTQLSEKVWHVYSQN